MHTRAPLKRSLKDPFTTSLGVDLAIIDTRKVCRMSGHGHANTHLSCLCMKQERILAKAIIEVREAVAFLHFYTS